MATPGYAVAFNRVDVDCIEPQRRLEGLLDTGAAGYRPGMLLKLTSNQKYLAHATQYGAGECLILNLDSYSNGFDLETGTKGVGDRVNIIVPKPGDSFLALVANLQNLAAGDQLVSNGAGKFRKVNASTDFVFAIAVDSLDLSAAGADYHVVARRI